MLRLISYLAPSIPKGFYETVANAIFAATGLRVELKFEERFSGPLPDDDNPFANGTADVGFICAPTFKWSREVLDLLPVPVPSDSRARGRAVYYADVAVAADSGFHTIADLRGCRWAYNDRNSLSGWFSMVEHIAPELPHEFFGIIRQSGSHLESLHLLHRGEADAAVIDSNALRNYLKNRNGYDLRIIDSLGPFPIQPVVIRTSMDHEVKLAVRDALLNAHNSFGDQFAAYGFTRFIDGEVAVYA